MTAAAVVYVTADHCLYTLSMSIEQQMLKLQRSSD